MLPKSIQNLIDQFSKLPGVGPKTAARLVFYLLSKPTDDISDLGQAILNLKQNLIFCRNCYNISENELCRVCQDQKRDQKIIAVVEEPLDVIALEKSAGFSGVYHVLGGSISPIDGIGPGELRIKELIEKVKNDEPLELILATNPDYEGEATAVYIKDQLKDIKIKITRIARGLPVGGDMEYADEVTLKRSIEGRREYI